MSGLFTVDFWLFVGVLTAIYTLFALGLQLEFGFTGLLNIGHVAFMAIGAYTTVILVVKVGMPLWLSAALAIAMAMVAGLLLGLPTLRLRGDYLAITTLAFAEIIRHITLNETALTGGSQGTINLQGSGVVSSYTAEWNSFLESVSAVASRVGLSLNHTTIKFLVAWMVVLIALALLQWLVGSPWGRVIKGIREDEEAVAAMGKNVFYYKQQVMVIGSAIAAVAGVLYALHFSFFGPNDFVPLVTFFGWMIMILGGVGRIWGVPLGALLFSLLYAGTRFLDFPLLSELDSAQRAYFRMILIGLALIALMMFRPQGILGKREEMVIE